MFAYLWLGFAFATFVAALSVPSDDTELFARQGTPSGSGFSNGFFWYFETEGSANVTFTNGPQGEYSVVWGSGANFVAGKGWNPGRTTPIAYSGTWQISGDAYVYVYGMLTKPLGEYEVVESFGSYDPSTAGTYKGSFTSDGSLYKLYTIVRTNEPSVDGTATWTSYWSIRQSRRTGGTISISNHFAAWESIGFVMGTLSTQIVAVSGYSGTGSADVTVYPSGTVPTSTSTSTSTSPTATPTGNCAARYAQCGGIGWTGLTCCVSPYACQVANAYYSECL